MGNRQLRFMSIGGNCADIGYLGEHRIRGPVDNVNSIYGLRSSELLFKEKLYNEIFETEPVIKPRIPGFETDSKLSFFYKMHEICHNDPRTPEYKQEFMKRLKNFKNFLKNLLTY